MEDYNWEYVDDNIDNLDSYNDSMIKDTDLEDIYYEDEKNEWENYYNKVHEEIEY